MTKNEKWQQWRIERKAWRAAWQWRSGSVAKIEEGGGVAYAGIMAIMAAWRQQTRTSPPLTLLPPHQRKASENVARHRQQHRHGSSGGIKAMP